MLHNYRSVVVQHKATSIAKRGRHTAPR